MVIRIILPLCQPDLAILVRRKVERVNISCGLYQLRSGGATFTLDGIPIENADSFTNLGSQISTDSVEREDVELCIGNTTGAVLLYGCETWLVH